MKKVLSLAAAFAMTASMTIPAFADEPAAKKNDIVILYTNDVHCGVDDAIGYDGLMLYKREMLAEHENVLLVDAGDAIQGGTMGTLTKGAYITDLMNSVGYDAAVPGNHEFDFTIPVLKQRASELSCGYISCNFKDKFTGETIFDPYKIIDLGDQQIAFIGVTTPETFITSTPIYFQNEAGEYIYDFSQNGNEFYEVIQSNVDRAIDEGADKVIILGHLGETDVTKGLSAQEVAENTTGIDVIIDAHSHDVTPSLIVQNKNGEDVTITQTGTKLANIGKMTIDGDVITTELIDSVPAPGESFDPASWTEADDRPGRYVDAAVNLRIHQLEADLDNILSEKVGETAFELIDRDPQTGDRRVRNSETNLGDFIADAFKNTYGTDVAIMNGGGIRKNIAAGDITYRTILDVFPFNNTICCAKVTGQQILDFLELGVSNYPSEFGGFPNIAGIEFTIDTTVPSSVVTDEYGAFVKVDGEYRVWNVRIGGKPLDLNKTYTVTSLNYLLKNGGDGFIFTNNCDVYYDKLDLDIDVIKDYIVNDLGGVIPEVYRDPNGTGRITVSEGKKTEEPVKEPENEIEHKVSAPVVVVSSSYGAPGKVPVIRNNTPTSGSTAQNGTDSSAPAAPAAAASGENANPATGAAASTAAVVLISAVLFAKSRRR